MSNHNHRRQAVDELVKNLTLEDVPTSDIVATLMRSHKRLDDNGRAERDALKDVLASNIILAKAVRTLSVELSDLTSKYKQVCDRLNSLELK